MRNFQKASVLSVVPGSSSEFYNSFLRGFLPGSDSRIRLIGAFLLAAVVSACGGGGGGSSTSQPEQPAATVSSYLLQQEPHDMAETDSDYMSQVKVLALAEAPTGYEIEAADNAGATRPSIDSNGVITWRPIPADTGVRRFNLVVKGNNATTARLPFTIQVGPWRTMVDQTFDQSGGSQCDSTNQYCVTVAANQVAPGNANLRARLRVFVRADSGIALIPSIEGAVARPQITFRTPDLDALMPDSVSIARTSTTGTHRAKPADVFGPQPSGQTSDESPLPNLTDYTYQWTGTKIIPGGPIDTPRLSTLVTQSPTGATQRAIDPSLSNFWTRSAVFIPQYIARLSGDCGGTKACNKNHTPVLLLHGFNTNCNYSGGTGTWGRTDEFVRTKTGGNVFEFQYRTCMRFEEAAGALAEAVGIVRAKTGHKPLIVAHSFGGVVASTYLKGFGVRVIAAGDGSLIDQAVAYRNDVASLITVGAPLSGTAKHAGTTTSSRELTQGRDTADFTISGWIFNCAQITCHQAGAELSDNSNSTHFNVTETPDNYYLKGLHILGQSGDLIDNLRALHYPVPTRVLVANGNALPLVDSSHYCDAGDGLISVLGQAADPFDFLGAPFGTSDLCAKQTRDVRMNRNSDGVLSSSDRNVTYQFMMGSVTLPRTAANEFGQAVDATWHLRYAHTTTHRDYVIRSKEISRGTANLSLIWGEAADLTSGGRLFVKRSIGIPFDSYVPAFTAVVEGPDIFDVGEHPLATAIKEVDSNIVLSPLFLEQSRIVRGSVIYRGVTGPVGIVNSSGIDVTVPYTLQIFNKATGQSRARHSDRTDLQGNMLFDYGAWFERLEAVGVDFSKYYMVVTAGDPLECAPTTTRVDNLTADVDLGQITLCSGATTPIVTSLTFSPSGAGGTVTAIFDRSMQPRARVFGEYIRGSGDLWLNDRTYTFGIASFTPGGQITLRGDSFTSSSGVPMGVDRVLTFPG